MSEIDLPHRIERYGGSVEIERVALLDDDTLNGYALQLEGKSKDTRYDWYREHYHRTKFWELDGMDPRTLRDRVDAAIERRIDAVRWERCMVTERAEKASLDGIFSTLKQQAHVLFGLKT